LITFVIEASHIGYVNTEKMPGASGSKSLRPRTFPDTHIPGNPPAALAFAGVGAEKLILARQAIGNGQRLK